MICVLDAYAVSAHVQVTSAAVLTCAPRAARTCREGSLSVQQLVYYYLFLLATVFLHLLSTAMGMPSYSTLVASWPPFLHTSQLLHTCSPFYSTTAAPTASMSKSRLLSDYIFGCSQPAFSLTIDTVLDCALVPHSLIASQENLVIFLLSQTHTCFFFY